MNYPIYKHKKFSKYGKWILAFVVLNVILSLILPWYSYIHGSFLFVFMSVYVLKKHKGFKAFAGLNFALFVMLLVFDFEDLEFTWSLDFVFPSFLIFMGIVLFLMILIKKKSWKRHYDIHVYLLLFNILMVVLLFVGVIESNIMVVVTYSIMIVTVIIIRIRVGKSYDQNLNKFTHF